MRYAMGLGEKGKEIFQHVIEEVREEKQLDQKLVLQQTKEDLLKLQEDISYASVVLNELKKTGWVDQQKFAELEAKLRDATHKKEAVTEIAQIIDNIHNRYDSLRGDEKTKISTMTAEIAKSRNSLSGLRQEVLNNANIDYNTIQTKLDQKIDEKFNGHWYSFLGERYKNYAHRKIEEVKNGKQEDANTSMWDKITNSIGDWFYGLVGTLVIGKNVTDIIGEELEGYKNKLQGIGNKTEDLLEEGKQQIQNLSPEQLQEKEKKLRNYITVLVQKYGKHIDQATLDKVIKRLDVKKLASDNTQEVQKLFSANWEDANVAQSLLEGVSLPFYFGYEIMSALEAEGVISYSDIAFNVAGETVEYGLKGFKLFGTGMKLAFGSISMNDIESELKKVYDKSPDAAKTLIWAIMYRTQHSPIFKFAANTAEFLAKSALWPMLEAKGDIKSLQHITDGIQGHMTTEVKRLETFSKYLPAGQDGFVKNLISDFNRELGHFKEINEINVIYREHGNLPLEELEKKYLARSGGATSPFLARFRDAKTGKFGTISEATFTSNMKAYTSNITTSIENTIHDADLTQRTQKWRNKMKGAVQFKPSEASLVEDGLHNLRMASQNYANMMDKRGWFTGMKEAFSGMKGGILTMQESLGTGKTYFNFHTAEDFQEFMKKAKFLGKQSPETLKFMLGKMPIFLVGGMALGQDGTMSEKMKALTHDLWTLFPLIGPAVIIWDGAKAGKLMSGDPETWGQIGLGATLISMDVVKIIKYGATHEWGKLGRYIFQPVTDLHEIGVFAANATKNSIILAKDFINVAKSRSIAELGEEAWMFIRSEGRWARLAMVTGLVAGGYFTWEYFFSSNDIDEKTKQDLAKYRDNPNQLDTDIEHAWASMKQEDRNDYLRAAVMRQGGFSPDKISKISVKFDAQKNVYTAVLPSVVAQQQAATLKNSLADAVSRVQPGTSVNIEFLGEARYYFTKELQQQFADISAPDRKQKMEEYARAMGYSDPNIILDEKNIS